MGLEPQHATGHTLFVRFPSGSNIAYRSKGATQYEIASFQYLPVHDQMRTKTVVADLEEGQEDLLLSSSPEKAWILPQMRLKWIKNL